MNVFMKLPFNLPFGKKVKTEYFFGFLLRDEKINAVVFEETNKVLKICGEHEEQLSTTLNEISYEELLQLTDRTLSMAEESLPDGVETQKTIFGVKGDWVDKSQITKEHLTKLRKLSEELNLSPIGFLVISEAIIHLLTLQEGAPVSAILIEIGRTHITASMVRAGKVLETHTQTIENSASQTTDKILHHFTNYEILPSRILLFDGERGKSLQQEFISHSWSKSLPFLHVPQITILPAQYDVQAILYGTATQMGFEIGSGELEHVKTNGKRIHEVVASGAIEEVEEVVKHSPASSNDFGFVVNGDIETVKGMMKKPELKAAKETQETNEIQEPREETNFEEVQDLPDTHTSTRKCRINFAKFSSIISALPLGSITKNLTRLPKKVLGFLPSMPHSGKPILILGGIIIFIIAMAFFYFTMISATIIIFVTPKSIENIQTIIFSPQQPTDLAEKRIFVETINVEKEGNLSGPATGTKEVGEKAKGNVTIISSLTSEQTLTEGTSITSSNGLLFTLDNAVKIASSSGLSDIKSITASITAKIIGKEHNLPSGTKFSVGTFDRSSVEAKNDTAFTGGSKKEVTVVSQKDVDRLLAELPKSLQPKAQDEIKSKVSSDRELLIGFFKTTIVDKELSKKVSEEAASVNLKATISFEGFSYKKDDAKQLFAEILKQNDSSMTLSGDSISYSAKSSKQEKNGDTKIEMSIKGGLVPKIDQEKLTAQLTGKSFDDAIGQIIDMPQIADAKISLSPPIPFLPKNLPRMAKNIHVVITYQ